MVRCSGPLRAAPRPAWSAREGTLPGDVHGIVTTYQQVATSSS
nr:hypothetical protein [Candidatus Microthrix sp.]